MIFDLPCRFESRMILLKAIHFLNSTTLATQTAEPHLILMEVFGLPTLFATMHSLNTSYHRKFCRLTPELLQHTNRNVEHRSGSHT